MSDDVELYENALASVHIKVVDAESYLVVSNDEWTTWINIDIDRARQIGLGLIKWADEQKGETS